MGELTITCPKPMIPVGGKPILDHILELLSLHGVEDVILAAHYKAEVIERHFSGRSGSGLRPKVRVEEKPLGTAGGLAALRGELDDDFLLYYGDELADFNLTALLRSHREHAPLATILVRPSRHPWDGHLIQTNESGSVTELAPKLDPQRRYQNLGDLGIYVLSRRILDYIPPRKAGFFEDVFPVAIAAGENIRVHSLESSGYVLDVGTPERIADVERYLGNRVRIRAARGGRKPIATVFLDRDGVLIEDSGLIRDPSAVSLLSGAAEGVRLLNERGLRVIVVTNQPVVARGLCSEETLAAIHDELRARLKLEGAHLDAIYYCPHHPETQHEKGVTQLRRGCDCRKPGPGMLLQARQDLDLDLGACIMAGDSTDDIEAGANAGMRTVLLETGRGRVRSGGALPDYTFPTLLDASNAILAGQLK